MIYLITDLAWNDIYFRNFTVFATKYCFLILEDEFLFLNHFFIFRVFFFVILCYFVIINFYKNYVIIILFFLIKFFFHENYFYLFMFRDVPACSGMFRNVPECSMFRVLSTPRTRANQADITGLGTTDLWHEFQIRKHVFKVFKERDFWVAKRPSSDKIAMSLPTASQIFI